MNEQRVIKIFPYSYSSLSSFETCARKHYGERLSKEFARPKNEKADEGTVIHAQAENYALHGTDFDNPYKEHIIKVIEDLRGKGEFFAERELAVRIDKTPCGWWDTDCYTRAKVDFGQLQLDKGEATLIDWKTGRADPYSTQLKHSALLLMLHHPEIHTVHTRYEWLKEGYPTKAKIYREFFDADWANFEQRIAKYSKAFAANQWPAKKGFLCKKYCGVTTCENFGKSAR